LPTQVTDVTGLSLIQGGANSRLPLWVKIAWTVWLVAWAPLYWREYGAQNFLYFCDLGNLLIGAGLWLESRFILSWQAVSLLLVQTLYAVDLLGTLLLHKHIFGGTEYLFDATIPLAVRLMGLYHLVVPPLLVWCVYRLGFRRGAWKWAALEAWIIAPVNFFWRPQYNVNFVRGIGHPEHLVPAWVFLAIYLIGAPALIYWPTDRLLTYCLDRNRKKDTKLG